MPRLLTIWADMAQNDYFVARERDKQFALLVILYHQTKSDSDLTLQAPWHRKSI